MSSIYADGNNLFSIGKDINKVKDTHTKDFEIVTNWFYENFMVLILKNVILCVLAETGKMKHLLLRMYVIKIARKKLFWVNF